MTKDPRDLPKALAKSLDIGIEVMRIALAAYIEGQKSYAQAQGAIHCPACGATSRVLETRGAQRIRACSRCGAKWNTKEIRTDILDKPDTQYTLRGMRAGAATQSKTFNLQKETA